MNKITRGLTVLSFGWLAAGPPSARAGIVFDDLTGASTPFFGPGCCQIGDEITLSGTARNISLLNLGVSSQGIDIIAGIEMGIYANDGPGGSPGSLLWQSGPLTGLLIPANATEISVQVPDVTVPDVITVTSQILSGTPVALGRLVPALPTTGSFDTAWLESTPGVWGPGFAFAVQVEAVPEPASNVLIVTGLLAMALLASIRNLWAVESPSTTQTNRHRTESSISRS